MVAITSNKREHILAAVKRMYTDVADSPQREFHFPTGRRACRFVHYPDAMLEGVPSDATESFAGVGYPFAAAVIREGDTVLDIGSGSGTDTLIAARLVGPRGKVYAFDLTAAMRAKLGAIVERDGVGNVEILSGNAEQIPLGDASVDVITSNGVLNLVPNKVQAIAEIFRVLRPGGRLQLADIALHKPIGEKFKQDPELWAECVVGAVSEDNYVAMLQAAGFKDVSLVDQLEYFSGSSSDKTRDVAGLFGAHSIVLRAEKPAGAELEAVLQEQSSWRRRAITGARQLLGIGGAIVAAAACMGAPLVLSAFGAIGAAAFATHAYMFPLFVAFVAATSWGLYRQSRRRATLAPFWLGAGASLYSSIVLWVIVTSTYPLPLWSLYLGLAALLGASLWLLVQPLQPRRCLDEMVRDVARRERPRPTQLAHGAALSVAAAAAFYGMYKSVETFSPKAEASTIACYGINACKGQTQCRTALNGCPGQNACKGKGFLRVGADECSARGGQPLTGSPADPAKAS